MMRCPFIAVAAFLLALTAASDAIAQVPSSRKGSIELTEAALFDQLKCQNIPQVAHAINAMLEKKFIRYVDNENGVYVFIPTVPLTFLGMKITYISGFDYAAFKGVPDSTMAGTAPPVFLEIDVAVPANELRKRALDAGLVEGVPRKHKRGFEVLPEQSYLAPEKREASSGIQCAADSFTNSE